MQNVRFYNSSVIGYSLHDYANVVDQFVPLKPEIKYVFLFYCLNDVYDVSAEQILKSSRRTPSLQRRACNPSSTQSMPIYASARNSICS